MTNREVFDKAFLFLAKSIGHEHFTADELRGIARNDISGENHFENNMIRVMQALLAIEKSLSEISNDEINIDGIPINLLTLIHFLTNTFGNNSAIHKEMAEKAHRQKRGAHKDFAKEIYYSRNNWHSKSEAARYVVKECRERGICLDLSPTREIKTICEWFVEMDKDKNL